MTVSLLLSLSKVTPFHFLFSFTFPEGFFVFCKQISWEIRMTDWMGFGLLILVLVFHTVESEPDRQVVNTTCLELAKPSNQPLRLSCGTPDHYHCLLDETYTMEFEVCRAWKWIPGGNENLVLGRSLLKI